jgi:SAM-dependent methyltransferase
MWDERYREKEFAYGREPNDFLRGMVDCLPVGKTLCLAEGEGRNAVFLARMGHHVTAVDLSIVGLEKANRLAVEHQVGIQTIHSDLAHYRIAPDSWDAIVSIFAHVPPPLRQSVHREVVAGLRPGGVFLLEAYTPDQLNYRTGGPPVEEMMMTLESLVEELRGLEWLHAQELVRDVREGEFHHGTGAVVQLVGRKL